VDEIGTDGMQPGGPPSLCEEVIFAIVHHQSVEIVDPAFVMVRWMELVFVPVPGGEVELRPKRLVIERFPHGFGGISICPGH